jgi:fructuronate reductase
MTRLSLARLPDLPAEIVRPGYELSATSIGVVHFGPGAFHRVHQAMYIDELLAADPDWAICGVSLHSHAVRDALGPQDNLYTVAELGDPIGLTVIGAIRELLHAPSQQPAVLARLADPAVRLVTLTITEKGYCLRGENLDMSHPDIAHDQASPATPRSAIGYIVAGLAARRAQGVAPFTVLSCDNLPGNGHASTRRWRNGSRPRSHSPVRWWTASRRPRTTRCANWWPWNWAAPTPGRYSARSSRNG